MTVTGVTVCVIAVLLAYLIGAIPSAPIVARLAPARDTRRAGTARTTTGNHGARDALVNAGKAAGVAVVIADFAKGAGAVMVAGLLAQRAHLPAGTAAFAVFGAGVAALAGHLWPVYLRFAGRGGLATAFGVLAILLTREVVLGLAFGLVLAVVTRNLMLSAYLGLIWIPVNAWMDSRPWWKTAYPILLMTIMLLHVLPSLAASMREGKSLREVVDRLLARNRSKKADFRR